MTPERWQQVEMLFHAALDHEPGKRAAFLANACRGDEELQREVLSLLKWEPTDQSSIELPTQTLLSPGMQLGPYQLEARLGQGGMGEVFKARDTRLGRAVAIKIIDEQFSDRFQREAQAISALNHPHICTLYDVGRNYLVMELVEGETLAERIKKGPLPLELVLRYGSEITDALSAAHARGIVHRDLKPGNIMVTKAGIKVLDFGLAKFNGGTEPLTRTNVVLGTPAYMAPEQLESKECDARTDIYALGLLLYEMRTGRRGSVDRNPVEPAVLECIVQRCLEKDPEDRWQSARDLKHALTLASEVQPAATGVTKRRRWTWTAAASFLLLVVGLMGGWAVSYFRRPPAQSHSLLFEINPPEGGRFIFVSGGMALSPDGRTVAYMATTNGKSGLWVQSLDGASSRSIPGTESAYYPFWSPNSESIGFFSSGKLWRVDAAGGAPRPICDLIAGGTGAAWSSNGVIIFGVVGSALFRVPASGGAPSPLTRLDQSANEIVHCWPRMLPGNKFLYFELNGHADETAIYAASLATPAERVRIMTSETNALYVPGGDGKDYLMWLRGASLMAQEFDANGLRLNGEPHPIADPVDKNPNMNWMNVTASANGLLLYGALAENQIARLDRRGNVLGEIGEPGEYSKLRLSPDGRRVVVSRGRAGGSDLWIIDAQRGLSSRFTYNPEISDYPVWSPDGRMIAFTFGGPWKLFAKDANGGGEQQSLTRGENPHYAFDWSRDGRYLLYGENALGSGLDLWFALTTSGGRVLSDAPPRAYLKTPFDEYRGRFSPELSPRWVAYESNESGRVEIYVQAFPEPRGKFQISAGGGRTATWGTDGKEIFYLSPSNKLMQVSVMLGADSVGASAPHELFSLLTSSTWYDVTPDGQEFLILRPVQASQPLMAIVNWPVRLKKGAAGQ